MVQSGDDLRSLDLPHLRADAPPRPDEAAWAAWRGEAEARLEDAITELDQRLVRGDDPARAARRAIELVTRWVRRSLRAFTTEDGAALLGAYLRRGEGAAWERMAEAVVAGAGERPERVERWLRVYVEMSADAAARGFAALVAPAGGRR